MLPKNGFPIAGPETVRETIAELVDLQHREHQIQARKAELLAHCEHLTAQNISPDASGEAVALAHRALHADVAAALHRTDTTVGKHIAQSVVILEQYPQAHRYLREGLLSFPHAAVIADEGTIIEDPEQRRKYEESVVRFALHEPVGRVRPVAKQLAAEHSNLSAAHLHADARLRRHVRLQEFDHGMAELTAYLPAVSAYAIYDRVTRMAWKVKHHEAAGDSNAAPEQDPRALDEIRTDVLTDLLIAGTPSEALAGKDLGAIQGRVQVTVPERVLTTNDPDGEQCSGMAYLTGYGPIDAAAARDLAGHIPSWDCVTLTSDGVVLTIDRYQPSAEQRRFLRLRDQHCRFPGCRAPVHRCDVDHTIPASEGGPTATSNLAHLCRKHHVMKTHTDWDVTQFGGGVLKWVSPSGRIHYDKPVSRVMFREHDPNITLKPQPRARNAAKAERARAILKGSGSGPPSTNLPDGPHPF